MSTRVFVSRLAGLPVFDPVGDQVGRVRDVVVTFSSPQRVRAIGLVIEVHGRRRVFVPMTRVTAIDAGAVITTGLVNMRRFEARTGEKQVVANLLDRTVRVASPEGDYDAIVEDVAFEQNARRDWMLVKVFVRRPSASSSASQALSRLTRRRSGATALVPVDEVSGLQERSKAQSAERLLETYDDLRVADLAEVIHDLEPERRAEVAAALDDNKLADVLEELPEDDQVEIIAGLATDRAADVLEAMEPDDAADLLADLPPEQAEALLQRMEPDDAADLRRLLTYDENTAGGLMTTEPVLLGPDATIAEALAMVRREELAPALASAVFVTRPPHETPTGRYIGMVHTQRLLREPPHSAVGQVVDSSVEPIDPSLPLAAVTRTFATYNLVAMPVCDDAGRLVGVVTVDDVLDHVLPDDWRERRHELHSGEQPRPTTIGGRRG
ncbi:Mg/Co/Ni transporter MgtE [Barrientosiimonas humi]|uniref:Mg/Co/Ni transporter MgtE n=2 Tax=Barrientosiimonas TaxID=1535207 RepID=A0A542X951_9MICO|nr:MULTISPECIES: CBS domain-containing protein [Barrientosiimonas]TQL32365.1 Mg/Co/Ni transporter MgtE [Barrientosiimonas humi]BDZ57117.1 magnesium transporter [Barrientosiimonas endolithica]CAG7572356.1 Magnesium transporter MgtE [Barrientosiimonas humi]